jgi:hypothetical protein
LRIEAYFLQIQNIIAACSIVQTTRVTYDKRTTYEGYIRGEIYFVDGTVLHIREFADVETKAERLVYAYQYMNANHGLIFRYDNTGHHKKLKLDTYPHHKHEGTEDHVIASHALTLAEVLIEIEMLIVLP